MATEAAAPPSPPSTSQRPHRRRRAWHWVLGIVGALLALLIVAALVIANWDWNRARPWVNQKVSEATGRHFAIEGDLTADWHWPQPLERGWRRWVPGVTVQAKQLVMDNPPGFVVAEAPERGDKALPAVPRKLPPPAEAKAEGESRAEPAADGASATASSPGVAAALQREAADPTVDAPPRGPQTMGTVGSASATLSLLPLLARTVVLDTVVLTAPDIVLGRRDDGTNNWTFKKPDAPRKDNPWDMSVGQLIIRGGWLGYVDGAQDLAVRARIDTIDTEPGAEPGKYGLRFALQGRYRDGQVSGEGEGGAVLTLRDKEINYPLRFKARAGSISTEVEGTLTNPASLDGLDMQVVMRGASMADLYDLTGLVLPNTPPFETNGRLRGSLEPERAVWEYQDFDGKVGQSDLHGHLKYTSGKPRPVLTGNMQSNRLRLADLGPVLGTNKPDNKNRGRNPGREKVLPNANFSTERWKTMDVDIRFQGKQIIRPESLPLNDLSTHAVLKDAQLRLDPLTFGVADGKIKSQVSIDGRKAPLQGMVHATVEGLQLSSMFPKVELARKSLGRVDGALALQSTGNSPAALLGNGTGELRLYVRDGRLSKQLLDLAALNVGSIIVAKLFGDDREVQLRCAVADFTVQDGLAHTRVVKMSTEDAVVEATGTVNLGTEEMDLRIKPESLEWKFFSLRSPLYVRGTFGNPQVGVETGPLIARAAAAVAAIAVAPAALALVPVTVPAADDDTYCKPLLDLAKAPPRAGRAGAERRGAGAAPTREGVPEDAKR